MDKLSQAGRKARYSGRKLLLLAAALAVAGGIVAADRYGLFGWRSEPDAKKYDGKTFKVVKVVDGDTLDLDIPDGKHAHTRVRLRGVDTPETKKPGTPIQHFGPEASRFTADCAMGKAVRIELEPGGDTRDVYNRLLAFVILPDGRMLNRRLVEEGYGYTDIRFPHHLKKEFERLEYKAYKDGLGLWKTATLDDMPAHSAVKARLAKAPAAK